jgi:hypothetical protein
LVPKFLIRGTAEGSSRFRVAGTVPFEHRFKEVVFVENRKCQLLGDRSRHRRFAARGHTTDDDVAVHFLLAGHAYGRRGSRAWFGFLLNSSRTKPEGMAIW